MGFCFTKLHMSFPYVIHCSVQNLIQQSVRFILFKVTHLSLSVNVSLVSTVLTLLGLDSEKQTLFKLGYESDQPLVVQVRLMFPKNKHKQRHFSAFVCKRMTVKKFLPLGAVCQIIYFCFKMINECFPVMSKNTCKKELIYFMHNILISFRFSDCGHPPHFRSQDFSMG